MNRKTEIGAGGDPLAIGFVRNPYNTLPSVCPDDGPQLIVKAMLSLQRRKLSPEEDLAFRTLRNLATRLSWDLQTLGTTPSIQPEAWSALRVALRNGQRCEAEQHWLADEQNPANLHVRAVLSLNEVAWQLSTRGSASDDALRGYVAWWSALLFHKEWLHNFALSRCGTWTLAPPDAGDQAQFLDRTEKSVLALLSAAAGGNEKRAHVWSHAMDQERAAIEAITRACGSNQNPAMWPGGYGPLGLRLLGKESVAQEWISENARAATGEALPLTALKANLAGFYQLDPDRVATAARAVQFLLSELGVASAMIWSAQPQKALELLRNEELSTSPVSAWFGTTTKGRRSRGEAIQLLSADALLLQLQDELGRPEVPAESVCETAARILTQSGSLPQPRVAVRQVETRLCGRVAWCVSGERLPDPREIDRILSISLEVHSLLTGRGEGRQCALEVAKLLNHRAVGTWNRAQMKGRPLRLGEQESIMRDLFLAVTLAPHSQEIVGNLAGLAVQFPTSSVAERTSLLARVLSVVKGCIAIGKPNPQLEDSFGRLLELADPEEARRITMEKLRKAMAGNRNIRG